MIKLLLISAVLTLTPFIGFAHVDPKLAYSEAINGDAIIIDARDAVKVNWQIASGAYWMQFPASTNELPNLIAELTNCLPRDKKIYFYCYAGNWSAFFAENLQANGLQAFSIGAFDDWMYNLLPTEVAHSRPNSSSCHSLR